MKSNTAFNTQLLDRETDFHDNWAQSTATDEIKVTEAFEAPTALENKYIIETLGDLNGRTVLDVGAGLCESSVYFALKGAQVTATDLSPGMLEKGKDLARSHGVSIETFHSPAEDLVKMGKKFDVIYAANLIHHLEDKERFLESVEKLLSPGGIFVSWDPIKYNPLIFMYRRLATKVRTPDENPLGISDLQLIKRYLPETKVRFFWLSSLILFLKYFVIDRVHPNKDRYWKKIYKESSQSLWWWKPFKSLDNALSRIPALGWLSWNMVVLGQKTESEQKK